VQNLIHDVNQPLALSHVFLHQVPWQVHPGEELIDHGQRILVHVDQLL